MGRPKVKVRRDKQLNFSLTADELTMLKSWAAAAGTHLVDYGRAKLLRDDQGACEPPSRDHEALRLDRLLFAQLSRLGNNLNQIARQLNSLRLPSPMELEMLIGEIRTVLRLRRSDDR